MKEFGFYQWIAYIAIIIGGINWGLIGLFRIDLFQTLFGTGFIYRIVCIAVGVGAGYLIYSHYKSRNIPAASPPPPTQQP